MRACVCVSVRVVACLCIVCLCLLALRAVGYHTHIDAKAADCARRKKLAAAVGLADVDLQLMFT